VREEVKGEAADARAVNLNEKYWLRSHMDNVRGIQFIQALDSLASISEVIHSQ